MWSSERHDLQLQSDPIATRFAVACTYATSTPAPATAGVRTAGLNNPFYNLHRFGISFTPSPRFADLLLVTGPVTHAMFEPLKAAYAAMPEPRWVMAVGTCAVSGGIPGGSYACGTGLEGVLPVDLYLPDVRRTQRRSSKPC